MAVTVNDTGAPPRGQPNPTPAPAPQQVQALTDEQFARIEELLLPGYELSTLMLEDYKRQREALATGEAGGEPTN